MGSSPTLSSMSMTDDDVLRLIEICLASVLKRKEGASADTMTYLSGYEDACKMLKEMIEKDKNKPR